MRGYWGLAIVAVVLSSGCRTGRLGEWYHRGVDHCADCEGVCDPLYAPRLDVSRAHQPDGIFPRWRSRFRFTQPCYDRPSCTQVYPEAPVYVHPIGPDSVYAPQDVSHDVYAPSPAMATPYATETQIPAGGQRPDPTAIPVPAARQPGTTAPGTDSGNAPGAPPKVPPYDEPRSSQAPPLRVF